MSEWLLSGGQKPFFIQGSIGDLECLHFPAQMAYRGVAVVAHPNPLHGGTFTNKVVQTTAKTLSKAGYAVYCPNCRGVGNSAGQHDFGAGEVSDVLAVVQYAQHNHPQGELILAGFSFGAYVQSQLSHHVAHDRLLLLGLAAGKYAVPEVDRQKTAVIHGEADEVIPLQALLDWAKPQDIWPTIAPGVGHFFHGKLNVLAEWVAAQVRP